MLAGPFYPSGLDINHPTVSSELILTHAASMGDSGDGEWNWFPPEKTEWSLDVVGLLAVVGESSIEEHAQAITASLFGLLPRLIPAPQAFLKPTRPGRMPETAGKVTGVHSGISLDSMGYFANIITPLDEEPAFGFKVLDIEHAQSVRAAQGELGPGGQGNGVVGEKKSGLWARLIRTVFRSGSRKGKDDREGEDERRPNGRRSIAAATIDEEAGPDPASPAYSSARESAPANGTGANGLQRPGPRRRMASRAQDFLTAPGDAHKGGRPAVPPKLMSPIHILGTLSFFNTIAIVVMGVIWEDANAILSIALISLVSTIVGVASFWRPILMQRRQNLNVPPGDVIIRTREGAFLLVRCTEDVARELYSGTEECEYYVDEKMYRFLMGLGTVLLMISIVLLGNCKWNSQVFIGASYITLNGLYWTLGMLPKRAFWDLSRYKWTVSTPPDALHANRATDEGAESWIEESERLPSFTRTLWYAIRESKTTKWVQNSGAAPVTEAWKKWLKEAEENAMKGNRHWNAVGRKNDLMNVDKKKEEQRREAAEEAAEEEAAQQ